MLVRLWDRGPWAKEKKTKERGECEAAKVNPRIPLRHRKNSIFVARLYTVGVLLRFRPRGLFPPCRFRNARFSLRPSSGLKIAAQSIQPTYRNSKMQIKFPVNIMLLRFDCRKFLMRVKNRISRKRVCSICFPKFPTSSSCMCLPCAVAVPLNDPSTPASRFNSRLLPLVLGRPDFRWKKRRTSEKHPAAGVRVPRS